MMIDAGANAWQRPKRLSFVLVIVRATGHQASRRGPRVNAGSPRSVGIPGTVLYRTVNSTVIWTNLNHPSQPTPLKRTHTRAQPRDEPVADRPRPGRTDPGLDARVSTNYCILYSIVYLFAPPVSRFTVNMKAQCVSRFTVNKKAQYPSVCLVSLLTRKPSIGRRICLPSTLFICCSVLLLCSA